MQILQLENIVPEVCSSITSESSMTDDSDASWEDSDHVTSLSSAAGVKKKLLRKRLSTVSEEAMAEV